MRGRWFGGVLALVALSACATLPQVSDPTPSTAEFWRPVDASTGKIADVAGLQQLAREIPDSTSVRLRLLNAQLGAQDFNGALESLHWLKARGHVFSTRAREQLPTLMGDSRADLVRSLLLDPAEPIVRSSLHATVPEGAGLVESVLMDLEGGRMAVTSVSGRSVWASAPDGTLQPIAPAGAGTLSGIVFDPVRNTIWAASGNIDGGPAEDAGFAGLIEIIPGTEDGRRIAAPDGASLSDMHRARDGTIFVSAPLDGGIYRLLPDANDLETLVTLGTFRSPQGLVTSGDGKWLYVSDYRYGLAAIPLGGGKPVRVATALPIALDGIDGLWRIGDELVAVQNGTSPIRIVALKLSADGTRIIGHRILEQAHPEWTEPVSGYVGEGSLYYVANGQWDRWVDGKPVEGRPLGPTYIFRLPLD